jgi:hypothetical protein
MRALCLLSLCVYLISCPAQLTQRQACAQFSDAIVRIDSGGQSKGTGFLVSPEGYILTASHVVREHDGRYSSAIAITLFDGTLAFAQPAIPISMDSVGQDFALLKIEAKHQLPFIPLGSVNDVKVGADATIIGYPFSAINIQGGQVSKRFCLTATFAATDSPTQDVRGMNKALNGTAVPIDKSVKVDIVYFQGPSIKGISGSPLISRDTGSVVGIVSTKLTGITPALDSLREQITTRGVGNGIIISGLQPGATTKMIIDVLDSQLANGLGAAVGIDDPKRALSQIQQKTHH